MGKILCQVTVSVSSQRFTSLCHSCGVHSHMSWTSFCSENMRMTEDHGMHSGPNKSCLSLKHYCFIFGTRPFVILAGNPQNNSNGKGEK